LLATGRRKITAVEVTDLLGLAPAARLSRLVELLVQHDAKSALAELDAAIAEGAEVGQLIDQLLGYNRDVLVLAVGGSANQMLYALPGQHAEVEQLARQLGVQRLLAISQILDQTASRLRISTQVRTLAEMAIVRVCHLEDLDEIAGLIEQLSGGEAAAIAAPSKKNEPVRPSVTAGRLDAVTSASQPRSASGNATNNRTDARHNQSEPLPQAVTQPSGNHKSCTLDAESVEPIWKQALERLTGVTADYAACATKLSVDAQGRLVASFPESQKFSRDSCLRPVNLSRIEAALSEVCGGRIGLVLTTHHDPAEATSSGGLPSTKKSLKQQPDMATEPFVQRAVELFEGDSNRLRYVAPNNDAHRD
jgi:DNA polymerase-3 subunit gamma/tau